MGSHFQRLLTTYDKGEIPVEPSGVSVGTFRVRIMNIAVDRGDTSITSICCFIQILLLRQTGCAVLYCTQPAWRLMSGSICSLVTTRHSTVPSVQSMVFIRFSMSANQCRYALSWGGAGVPVSVSHLLQDRQTELPRLPISHYQ